MLNHWGSLTCIILGLIAIVDYKAWSDQAVVGVVYPNYVMYSPHSWLGVCTVALFGIQILYSLVIFYFMKWSEGTEETKRQYIEVHHFMGHAMFALGLATCATGFQSMQSSDLAMADMPILMNTSYVPEPDSMEGYGPQSVEAQLASAGSILLFALGFATFSALKFLPLAKNIAPSDLSSVPFIGVDTDSYGNIEAETRHND